MVCINHAEASIKRAKLAGIMAIMPKINEANEIIRQALESAMNPRISFSGGKDSLVVRYLVVSQRPDVQIVWCNTGNEYRETIPFVRSFPNLVELKPEKTFWQCWDEYGAPNKRGKSHGSACCRWLKEKPFIKYYTENAVDLVFTGLTADESRQRKLTLIRMGHTYYNKAQKGTICHPIYNWSEDDVWSFIHFKELKYNPIYDMGIRRTGCRFCTSYKTWKDTTSRYNEIDTHLISKKMGFRLLKEFGNDDPLLS